MKLIENKNIFEFNFFALLPRNKKIPVKFNLESIEELMNLKIKKEYY